MQPLPDGAKITLGQINEMDKRQCIWDGLHPLGVAVVIEANHACMTARGVRTPGVGMITSRMMGTFLEDDRSRKEVLSLMGY